MLELVYNDVGAALGIDRKKERALKGRSRCMLELVYNDVGLHPGLLSCRLYGAGLEGGASFETETGWRYWIRRGAPWEHSLSDSAGTAIQSHARFL